LRVLAGKVPGLEKYAHQKHLEDIEDDIAKHFGPVLSDKEKETLTLCRQLRNKLLHSDFYAMREKLRRSGAERGAGGVIKVDLPVATIEEVEKKIASVKAGTEGIFVASTGATGDAGVYGWLMEVGQAGDFEKAAEAFKKAQAIVDRLNGDVFLLENCPLREANSTGVRQSKKIVFTFSETILDSFFSFLHR
jgi:hypothetical protein